MAIAPRCSLRSWYVFPRIASIAIDTVHRKLNSSVNSTSIRSVSFLRFFWDTIRHDRIGQVVPRFFCRRCGSSVSTLTLRLQLSDPVPLCLQRRCIILAATNLTRRRKATTALMPCTFQSKISRSLSRVRRCTPPGCPKFCSSQARSCTRPSARFFPATPEGPASTPRDWLEHPTCKRILTEFRRTHSHRRLVVYTHLTRRSLIPDRNREGALACPQVSRTDCGSSFFKEHT
jgi:hypothetical protein